MFYLLKGDYRPLNLSRAALSLEYRDEGVQSSVQWGLGEWVIVTPNNTGLYQL